MILILYLFLFQVAILDIDICGPSVPRIMGTLNEQVIIDDN